MFAPLQPGLPFVARSTKNRGRWLRGWDGLEMGFQLLPHPFASGLQASATWQATLKGGDSLSGNRRAADYVHRPRYERYDFQTDPEELVNLAEQPEHKTI